MCVYAEEGKTETTDETSTPTIIKMPSAENDVTKGYEKKSVLIVDDDIDVAEVLEALIESEFNVRVETDEFKALELIKNNHYDIVISDLNMPKMSGQELVEEIMSTKPELTIIISSGHQEDSPEVQAAIKSGARGVIAKPFGDTVSLIKKLTKITAA